MAAWIFFFKKNDRRECTYASNNYSVLFRPLPPNGNSTDNLQFTPTPPPFNGMSQQVTAMSFSPTSGQAARRTGPWADLAHSATRPRPDSPRPSSGQSLHPFLGTGNFPLDAPLAPDASPADPGAWQILGERHPSERHQSERRPTGSASRPSSRTCLGPPTNPPPSSGQTWSTCSTRHGQTPAAATSLEITRDKEICSVTASIPSGHHHNATGLQSSPLAASGLETTPWPTAWRLEDAQHPMQRTIPSKLTGARRSKARLSVPRNRVRFQNGRPKSKPAHTPSGARQAQRPPKIQWDDLQVRLRVHEKMCARLGWVLADPTSSFQRKAAQTQHLLCGSRRLFIELRKLKRRDDATLQAQCLGR